MPPEIQQLLEVIAPLMQPQVFGALTVAPAILQWAKKLYPPFTGAWAAALSPVIAVALVLLNVDYSTCPWTCVVLNCVFAWLWIELVYTRVIEPMSKTSNPLIPDA